MKNITEHIKINALTFFLFLNICIVKFFTVDWIRTMGPRYQKPPLCQLSHNQSSNLFVRQVKITIARSAQF